MVKIGCSFSVLASYLHSQAIILYECQHQYGRNICLTLQLCPLFMARVMEYCALSLSPSLPVSTAEEVEGGSLSFKVKYNSYFPVVNKKKDLCNIPKILNEPCPIQPGVYDATLYQTFPSYALSVRPSYSY